jgi:hypothetical protein
MTRRFSLLLIAISAAATVANAQGMVANGGFEGGLGGWEAVAREGGTASLSTDKPAEGKSCLLLPTTGKTPTWVLSPALTGPGVGELAVVSFSARRASGQSGLALDIVGAAADLSDAVIWEALPPPDDNNWHKYALLLRVPPVPGGAAPRLAFGVIGAAGSWALDEVAVAGGSLPAAVIAPLPGGPMETVRLPEDWKPEGTLDARSQLVGQEQELQITVNGITVTARPDLICYRGFREGMIMYAVNRGKPDKELRVTVAAPASVESPAWTVPVKGDGTTRFHVAVQCLRQGAFHVKLTFASASDQASLPITVTSRRCYPALGVWWDGAPTAQQARAALQVSLDLQLMTGPADYGALGPLVEPLRALGVDLLCAPRAEQLTDGQFAAALAQLGGQMDPSFWVPYAAPGADPGAAEAAAVTFAALQRKQVRSAGVFSPPLDLRRTWPDAKLVPVRGDLLSAEKTAGLMAVTVRPPRYGAPCVIGERLDGKSDGIGGALASLTRQADLASVRGLLAERQISLPLLVTDLRARSSGDERLDALYLARAVTLALYQGSTGVLLAPQRGPENGFGALPAEGSDGKPGPIAQVLRELSQALGAATPVVALAATEGVSTSARAPVSFRPFLRGGEGLLVMWNNTGTARDVSLEFRSQPVVGQYVRLSYQGDFVQRSWDPVFKFGEEAFARKRPLLVVRLSPLDVYLMSFRLLDPHVAWLRTADLAKPLTPATDSMPAGREERTWWRDMLSTHPEEIK